MDYAFYIMMLSAFLLMLGHFIYVSGVYLFIVGIGAAAISVFRKDAVR